MRLCHLLCLLGALASQCLAKSRIGAAEKIWLWYAYQAAWKMDGKMQNWILPFMPRDRTTLNNNGNRGTGTDGMLTWPEFLQIICPTAVGKKLPPPPDGGGTNFEEVWNELWKWGYGAGLGKMVVLAGRRKAKGSRRVVDDKQNTIELEYRDLINWINVRLEHARIRDEKKIKGELLALRKLTNMILQYREVDTRRFLGGDVAKLFFSGDINKVHHETIPDPNSPGGTVQVIEVKATASDPKNATDLQRAFKTRGEWQSEFELWCNYYGSNEWIDNFEEFEKNHPANNHFETIVCWRGAKNAINRPVRELRNPIMGKPIKWNYDDPRNPIFFT